MPMHSAAQVQPDDSRRSPTAGVPSGALWLPTVTSPTDSAARARFRAASEGGVELGPGVLAQERIVSLNPRPEPPLPGRLLQVRMVRRRDRRLSTISRGAVRGEPAW